MKKLVFAIAVAMIASLFYSPVMASDFTAGGSYRAVAEAADPGAGTDAKSIDQRFRVKFNWAVNDNVSATLRGDFAEFMWGDGYRPESGTDTLMVDRAYVTINQGMLTLKVGQQAGSFGLGTMWSDQFAGIQADLAFEPVTLKLLYTKESEGGPTGNTNTDEGVNDDDDIYGISLLYANDVFSGGLSYAGLHEDATDGTKNGYSVHASIPFGIVNLSSAVDLFTGDNGAGTDYDGMQAHLAADFKLTDQFQCGITGLWADDSGANDIQLTSIQDDMYFTVLDYAGALGYDTAGSINYSLDIFDVSGGSDGVVGLVGDATFAATDKLTFYGKIGFAEPNGDANLESKFYAIANFDYAWLDATTVSGGVAYAKADYASVATNDDAQLEYVLRLGVGF